MASAAAPDVRQLAVEKLPTADFPGGRDQAFRVFFDSAAHQQVWAHARADTGVEICGVLVGRWERDAEGPFVNVSASIRGEAAANKFAEVTFTHETWAAINAEMDAKYADRSIVGWYHTHPDFGIFLSDRDRFIQENFFSSPGQIAHVVDPIRGTEGVFVWNSGRPTVAPYFWVGDRLAAAPPERTSERTSGERGAAERGTNAEGLRGAEPARPAAKSEWFSVLQTGLPYLLTFLIGWLLAGRLGDWSINRARQEGVALAFYQLGLRPDLDVRLSEIQSDLGGIADAAARLAPDHLRQLAKAETPTEETDRVRKSWKEIDDRLERARDTLAFTERAYCLDAEQRMLVHTLLRAKSMSGSGDERIRSPAPHGSQPKATDKPPQPEQKAAPDRSAPGAGAAKVRGDNAAQEPAASASGDSAAGAADKK